MANTGYTINPKVIQIFTSGPNSGSEVSSSYNIEFNPSSSFTSLIKCDTEFEYRIYNPEICPPETSSICPQPLNNSKVSLNCNSTYDYIYYVTYNPGGIQNSIIEYSLSNNFVGETGSLLVSNSSGINYIDVDISNLNTLPINNQVPVYFRIKNICGNDISSSYNNVFYSQCDQNIDPSPNYLILLAKLQNPCVYSDEEYSQQNICIFDDSFCGNYYYINSNSFSGCTLIKKQDGINNANPGWYYDGYISRQWNGSFFTQTIICP